MDNDSITALRRFGLGPRPGEWREMEDDPRGRVLASLRADGAAAVPDRPGSAELLLDLARVQAETKAAKAAGGESTATIDFLQSVYRDEVAAHHATLSTADAGLPERLVLFFSNHFTVAVKSVATRLLVGAFVREAIRPHVLGRFQDLLVAVATHPAMLHYLDNVRSIGPNSPRGQRHAKGFNENLAREILELHTVGVGGGYDQGDVTALARIITGWTVRDGRFAFDVRTHEPGDFTVMGTTYREAGVQQGLRVLADLARAPATGRRLATKLVRHFVGDGADPALAESVAARFRDSEGDLRETMAALIGDERAWTAPPAKVLPPLDMVVAFARALGRPARLADVLATGRTLGQMPWMAESPEGFPDDDLAWASPDGLLTRLDLATKLADTEPSLAETDVPALADALYGPSLGEPTLTAIRRAESREQALALLLLAPEMQRR